MNDLQKQFYDELMSGANADDIANEFLDALNAAIHQKEEEEEKAAAAKQCELAKKQEAEAINKAVSEFAAKYYPEAGIKEGVYNIEDILEGMVNIEPVFLSILDSLEELFGDPGEEEKEDKKCGDEDFLSKVLEVLEG